ncbi:unnamed protein product, partial [Brenthis ino]
MKTEQIQPSTDLQHGHDYEYGVPKSGRLREYCQANNNLGLQLCEQRAFDEAEAQRVLCATPEGIAIQFTKKIWREDPNSNSKIQNSGISRRTRQENRKMQETTAKKQP